jgi:signal transduction histidine kinase
LLRDGVAIGVIAMRRREVRPFSDKQIKLLETFADQAVIAIENVRLFKELEARNAELSESLEQQTATTEILRVISSSPTDVQPVFDAIAESAARLCSARDSAIRIVDGDTTRIAAHFGSIPHADRSAAGLPILRGSFSGRAILERRTIHIPDTNDEQVEFDYPETIRRRPGDRFRTTLIVPLLRVDTAIGTIDIRRQEAQPFSDKQIELLQTFAAQAVIAIENVRLFKELQTRNAEVTEALEQQTATAEILQVISSSPTDLQPVFDAILDKATQLCDSNLGVLGLYDGENYQCIAARAGNAEVEKWALDRGSYRPNAGSSYLSKVLFDGQPMQAADLRESPGYRNRRPMQTQLVEVVGVRTHLAVPMLKDGRAVGSIGIYRPEVRPFTQKQIDLVSTFANQAVIAIENVRLFKELQAQTEALSRSVNQLTALGEVGQAISSTLDLETVLQTIVSHAMRLTGLDAGVIHEYDDSSGHLLLRASESFDDESVALMRGAGLRKGEGAVGISVATGEPTQVPDTHAADYPVRLRALLDGAGFRAILAVPLVREEQVVGALMMLRRTPGAFAPEIVDLLKTFATQSALAIQNARLFREIAEKGRQLEVASQHKSQFLASMSHELRTPLNAMLGFNEMILGEIYGPVPADIQSPLADIQSSGKHLLRLINNVLDLAKIEAGRMELSLTDYSVHDIVERVRSTLHPLAADKGLEFTVSVSEDIPFAYGDFGRISQCLMNLAGNSLKFTRQGHVQITVDRKGDLLVYRVADTGIGIPPEKIDSLFTEFKQTDATIASEFGGTGLGLSITKKFVEIHGGRIWVESELGQGSEFICEIPLRAAEVKS